MKIVLIGKNGQLGREFQGCLPRLGETIALGRADMDVTDPQAVPAILLNLRPDLIINASAYTDVDQAETQFKLAEKVNAIAPGIMAEAARKIHAVLIHYSTDYVFDGKTSRPYTEQDPTHPLNVYGKSKLLGEEYIKQSGEAFLILRTSWVYSLQGNSFVNKVLSWSREKKVLKIVSDQIGSPTWAGILAESTCQVISNNAFDLFNIIRERHGVYHLAGSGYTSRFEWAQRILSNDSKQTEQLTQTIEPAASDEFTTPALRPLFTALDCTKFNENFGLRLPDWEKTLQLAMTG